MVNNYFPDVLEDQRSLALGLSPSFSLSPVSLSHSLLSLWASLISQLSKESACNAGDLGSIPGLGRSPGEGKGYPLPYPGLENSMDYIVHGVTSLLCLCLFLSPSHPSNLLLKERKKIGKKERKPERSPPEAQSECSMDHLLETLIF